MNPSSTEVRVDRLIAEVENLTSQIKQLIELTPQRNKVWLRPSEIAQLIGVTNRQIARYREQGIFKVDRLIAEVGNLTAQVKQLQELNLVKAVQVVS